MRQRHGFSLIELMVSSAVTFLTVLTVSAAFLNYSQSFYTQAGIRGGQASLRQSHLMVIRNLRMAGYGMDPHLAFGFPANWERKAANNNNLSNRLVFRMRNPSFNAFAASLSAGSITLTNPLRETLRQGQIIQAVCQGAVDWSYAQLSADAPAGSKNLTLKAPGSQFPNLNLFNAPCFGAAGGVGSVYIFKIDVYDYSIRFIDNRPYLFRQHGLGSATSADPYGEPVAEDIEAFRVTFLRGDGTSFIPNPLHASPGYDAPLDDVLRGPTNMSPANIRAVVVGMVARSSTRDLATTAPNAIPAFGGEAEIKTDPITNQPLPTGVRRVVSEMTVQIRNMRSSEMPVPVYSLAPGACTGGAVPVDNYNCAGG
jgi:type IV pilus assembly protein PilW